MKIKKKDILVYLLGILLFITVCLSIFNFVKMYGWDEVCIAQQCTEWAYGEEWIKDNCHLDENNKYDYCNVVIEGKSYKVALEDINIEQARSCRESECFTTVMVKQEVKK